MTSSKKDFYLHILLMINSEGVRNITSVNYPNSVNPLEAFRPVFISGLLNLMRGTSKNNSKLELYDLLE